MYLIVDFSDLELEYTKTDIRFDENNADYTVGRLIKELCKGLETIGGTEIQQKANLCLLGPDEKLIDSTRLVSDLPLDDWDTIYLSRRR